MQEKASTAVFGTRTPAVQYDFRRPVMERAERVEPLSQVVRQGNKKYPKSPIYR